MPKLFSIGGYIVYFWSGEGNEPVHVHVSRGRPETNSTKYDSQKTADAWSRAVVTFPKRTCGTSLK